MAKLLSYSQMQFLAGKLGLKITDRGTETTARVYPADRAIAEDGTLQDIPTDNSPYWKINANQASPYARYVYYDNVYKEMRYREQVQIQAKDFLAACKKYFGSVPIPIFVKDRRISGLWVKRNQQLVKPSGLYVKHGGTIKKL